ncbi:MAG: zf-HC2 domain-containing protein [Chloroflexi bacterium]|nr:zf-HC2 domain-containing protein [Chloroflexota bacterium]
MFGRQLWQLLGRRDWRGDVSAYLDDELTPRERERVEARLARSDEMQAYLDDLRQMRTALSAFAAEPARAPFQITPEMLAAQTAEPLRVSNLERALRLSMTTAAVGVATFSAVLIFDAVDRPTVTFTTTAAGDAQADVLTAQAAAERAPLQERAAGADGTAVAVVSIASSESQEATQAVMQAATQSEGAEQVAQAEEPEPADQTTAAAYRPERDEQASQEQAYLEQAQAEEQAEEENWQQSAEEGAESAQAEHQQAAADPSRRALNAGSSNNEREEQEVNAEDVIAKPEEQPAQAAAPAEAAQEDAAPPAIESADNAGASETMETAELGGSGDGAGQSQEDQAVADAGTAAQSQAVASSARAVESEWPLPQRPQSSSVRLASDPSWEVPLQIALAIVAFGSLLAWILLTVMDRRRQT